MTGDRGAETTIGARIKRYRSDKRMSLSQLAREADISKSYLWSLENPPEGEHQQRPSGETLYAIAQALGVTMSDLLGRKLMIQREVTIEPSLAQFARQEGLSQADVEMLASIQWRGDKPKTSKRWEYIYRAIVMSRQMDDKG